MVPSQEQRNEAFSLSDGSEEQQPHLYSVIGMVSGNSMPIMSYYDLILSLTN